MNVFIPERKSGVGRSFKGLSQYLLHDEGRAATDARVAWTATHNLEVDDPDQASRIMAFTAMSQQEIQRAHAEAHGVPHRRSKPISNAVFHYGLSWHPGDPIGRDEMEAIARRSLTWLDADNHQAVIIAHREFHDDGAPKNPHVHIMVNRVHPETGRAFFHKRDAEGRMITEKNGAPKKFTIEGNAAKRLSAFALKVDRERGDVTSPRREENFEKRVRGEPYPAQRRAPRHQFERERQARARRDIVDERGVQRYRRETTEDFRAIRRQEVFAMRERQKRAAELARTHRSVKQAIHATIDREIALVANAIREDDAPKWTQARAAAEAQTREAEARENSLIGRLNNQIRAQGAIWNLKDPKALGRRLMESFDAFRRQGAARQAIETAMARKLDAVRAATAQKIETATAAVETKRARRLHHQLETHRANYQQMRAEYRQRMEGLRARWRQLEARVQGEDRAAPSRKAEHDQRWRDLVRAQQMLKEHRRVSRPPAQPRSRSQETDRGPVHVRERTRDRD